MATAKKAAKRPAAKKATVNPSRKGGYKKHTQYKDTEPFPVMSGVPLTQIRATEEEQTKIYNTLNLLKPGDNHSVLPIRFKSAVLRITQKHFPNYKIRTSTNKAKNIVMVWRTR